MGLVSPQHYRPADLGRPCPFCGNPVPKALAAVDHNAHPTCGPSELDLLERRGTGAPPAV